MSSAVNPLTGSEKLNEKVTSPVAMAALMLSVMVSAGAVVSVLGSPS